MSRFARVVRAAFAWWDEVPLSLRYLAIVVVLQLLGFWPPLTDVVRMGR
jgi:hypothetical protein